MPQYRLVWDEREFNKIVVGVFELDEIEALKKLFGIMRTEDIPSGGGGGSLKWYLETTDTLVNSSTVSGQANVTVATLGFQVNNTAPSSGYNVAVASSGLIRDDTEQLTPVSFAFVGGSNNANIDADGNYVTAASIIASTSSTINATSPTYASENVLIAGSDNAIVTGSSEVSVTGSSSANVVNSDRAGTLSSGNISITLADYATAVSSTSVTIDGSFIPVQAVLVGASSNSTVSNGSTNSAIIASSDAQAVQSQRSAIIASDDTSVQNSQISVALASNVSPIFASSYSGNIGSQIDNINASQFAFNIASSQNSISNSQYATNISSLMSLVDSSSTSANLASMQSTVDATSVGSSNISSIGSTISTGSFSSSIASYGTNISGVSSVTVGSVHSTANNGGVVIGSSNSVCDGLSNVVAGSSGSNISTRSLNSGDFCSNSTIINQSQYSAVISSSSCNIVSSNNSGVISSSLTGVENSQNSGAVFSEFNNINNSANSVIISSSNCTIDDGMASSLISCAYSRMESPILWSAISCYNLNVRGVGTFSPVPRSVFISCEGEFQIDVSRYVAVICDNSITSNTTHANDTINLLLKDQSSYIERSITFSNNRQGKSQCVFACRENLPGTTYVEFGPIPYSSATTIPGGNNLVVGTIELIAYNTTTNDYGMLVIHFSALCSTSSILAFNAASSPPVYEFGTASGAFPFGYTVSDTGGGIRIDVPGANHISASMKITRLI